MGSKIEFGPAIVYIVKEDGSKHKLGNVDTLELINGICTSDIPIKRYDGDYSFDAMIKKDTREMVRLDQRTFEEVSSYENLIKEFRISFLLNIRLVNILWGK